MSDLYGRAGAIERAQARAARAWAGEGGVVLFTGEPGIGKSSVMERVAAHAGGEGARVVWGRCWEAGGAPAYWPWIQVFRGLGMATGPFDATIHDLASGSDHARFHAFDLAVRRLEAVAERAPLLLVLDDLHAADVPSLLLLLFLARELRPLRILVLGAYREAEACLDPATAPLVVKIAREAEMIPLARLPAEDVRCWLVAVEPAATDARAALLYRLTEGHPLLMTEALRLGEDARTPARILDGLRGVLDERLAGLSDRTRNVLATAAVLGREFAAAEVAATGELAVDDVHTALCEARDASIVATASTDDGYAFSHVLYRDRLYAELLPSTRVTLHWRAGQARYAGGAGAQASVHHFLEGHRAGDSRRLAEVAIAAAESALAQLAFEEAARLAEKAAQLIEPDPAAARSFCHLRLILAEASILAGEGARGKEIAAHAAALAEGIGADDLFASAALVYGTELSAGEHDPPMIALLRRALARLPDEDSPSRARVMARLSSALMPPRSGEDIPEIVALMRASTAMARRLGEGHTLLYVLRFALAAGGFMVAERERLALLQETMMLAQMLDQRLSLLATFGAYVTTLLALGKRADADAALASYQALLGESSQPQQLVRLRLVQALVAGLDGDLERSARLGGEARLLSERASLRAGMRLWATNRFSLAQLAGDPGALGSDAEEVLARLGTSSSHEPFGAWVLAGMGLRDEARARLRRSSIEPGNILGILGAAESCAELGERDLAPLYYGLLLPLSGRMIWSLAPGELVGPIARTLGDLALLIGRARDALRHYDDAIAFCEALRAPMMLAACRRRREAATRESSGDDPSAGASTAEAPKGARYLDFVREGDVWAIRHGEGRAFRLKHSKGLEYLATLIDRPGREIHVCELGGIEHPTGDAGPMLDARAKESYRARLEDLHEALREAEQFDDGARACRAQEENDAIAEQMAGAVGLGGRDRRAASDSERARINVQRRLKDAIDRITSADPDLGRYLALTVKTGIFCEYVPL